MKKAMPKQDGTFIVKIRNKLITNNVKLTNEQLIDYIIEKVLVSITDEDTDEQIKEKFGGLRFYYQGGDDFIHGAVWFAETMSTNLCEECGAPGHRTNGGYIQTLCKKHR